MRIFHIATVADWEAARASGRYTTSTRGRTLAEEGFIHASRGDQWQGVRERYYADVTEPLVLLVIDTARLTSPVVDEEVPGTSETFPHVFGPIDADAVVRTIALDPPGDGAGPGSAEATTGASATVLSAVPATGAGAPSSASFSRLFLEEMFRNVVTAVLVLIVVVLATFAGLAVQDRFAWGPITGAALGLVVGVLVVRRLRRARRDGC